MNDNYDVSVVVGNLDAIQRMVFENLDQIIQSRDQNDSANGENGDFIRTKLCRDTNNLLLKYQDKLTILSGKLKRKDVDNKWKAIKELYGDKLMHMRNQLRQTQVQSYEAEEELAHKQRLERYGGLEEEEKEKSVVELREKLFGSRSQEQEKEKEDQEKTIEDQILEHNKSISTSLQSTRQLMTTSIIQTELNIDSLDQQTKDLSGLDNMLVTMNDTLKKSRNIVKFIEKQDRSDKNRIYMSMGFFLICCMWILWRRVLKVPVKILMWSLLKIFRICLWMFPGNIVSEGPVFVSSVSSEVKEAITETTPSAVKEAITETTQLIRDDLIRDEL